MSWKISFLVILIFLRVGPVFAQKTTWYDLTGEGVKERIYPRPIAAGAGHLYYQLIIEQKTAKGWKNIFPKQCFYNKERIFFNSFSEWGGFLIGKFSQQDPGLQILIYFPATAVTVMSGEGTYFQGYFFKKSPRDQYFILYRKDFTDARYQPPTDYKTRSILEKQILKEFQGETKFTKAYKITCQMWDYLRNQQWRKAYSLCNPEELKTEEYSYTRNFLQDFQRKQLYRETRNLELHSFVSKVWLEDMMDVKKGIARYEFTVWKPSIRGRASFLADFVVDAKTQKISFWQDAHFLFE